MKATPIKTPLVQPNDDLFATIEAAIENLPEGSILAVTSKIVSLCEGRVVTKAQADKEELVIAESDRYMPQNMSRYGHHFTIAGNTLIAMAGIDESNGSDNYILWPENPQNTANAIRQHLAERFGLKSFGVIITDSTCQPLRRGTTGIYLAHSGFEALNNYIGQPDLFGRPFAVSQASVAGGLAAASVLAMGEGTEQTPLCLIEDVPFVHFQKRDPTAGELADLYISPDEDLFAPFLNAVQWLPGKRKAD